MNTGEIKSESNKQVQQDNSSRECGMMVTAGVQGVGKTYQNMYIIKNYVQDKLSTRVPGRKCLIFDTNGEYTEEQFGKNRKPNFKVKRIAIKDI